MQEMHTEELLIERHAPRVFHGASRERVSLSREVKALDGLELPHVKHWGIGNMRC
jgi:hypothetical protein